MTTLEEIIEQIEKFGKPTLEQLFRLNSVEIKKTVRDILGSSWFDTHCSGMVENGSVLKTYEDDQPKQIQIWYYDGIEITCSGIYHLPEHGDRKCVREFDKYFSLPEIPYAEQCRHFDCAQGRNKCTHPQATISRCKGICEKFET